jgi:hypothetical protein
MANQKLGEFLQARRDAETAAGIIVPTGMRFVTQWDDPGGIMQYYGDSTMPHNTFFGDNAQEIPWETKPSSVTTTTTTRQFYKTTTTVDIVFGPGGEWTKTMTTTLPTAPAT